MWIFSTPQIRLEIGIASALVAGGSLMWSPSDPFLLDLPLHPGWIAVLVLAARYGAPGLFLSIGAILAALSGAALAVGEPVALALESRLAMLGDALALTAALPIAWMAMMHESRRRDLHGRVEELEGRVQKEREASDALRDAVLTLRAKSDRVDGSLTFWRRVASRLQGGDAAQAARAALELCAVRAGARAGLVRLRRRGHWENVAWRGSWTADSAAPADIFSDRTIDAAIERGAMTIASEVDGVGEDDSDLAVPVVDPKVGRIVGMLALRGVPLARLGAAEIRDVAEIAAWISAPLSRAMLGEAADMPHAPNPSPAAPQGGKQALWP